MSLDVGQHLTFRGRWLIKGKLGQQSITTSSLMTGGVGLTRPTTPIAVLDPLSHFYLVDMDQSQGGPRAKEPNGVKA